MNNELVELVVQLYEKNWGVKDYGLARAVVALIRPATLEEAAKAAKEEHDALWKYGHQKEATGALQAHYAIRALKDKA